MANFTPNVNLEKPLGSEHYLIPKFNANMDKIDAKFGEVAPKDSPELTGVPIAPTALTGTNTNQIATTAFVKAVIAALVDSSPSTLDTLNELATALGDDPNFAATMATELGNKAIKPTNEAGASSNSILVSNGDGSSIFKNQGSVISEALEKVTPADDDMIGLMDSVASNVLKKLSWANIKALLSTESTGLKNWIINGMFDVWQRGVSQTTSGYGSDDRFLNEHGGSTKVHSQQVFTIGQTVVPNNPKYFSRTVVTSVAGIGNYVAKVHRIEDVTKLAGKTIAVSFWAKADANKNIAIEFRQNFGTGGSVAVSEIGVQKFALTTSWQKFTKLITLPSVVGKTIAIDSYLQMTIWFEAGSNFNLRTDSLGNQSGTFDIANVSLVEGSVAVECQNQPYADVLRECQRYYYRLNGDFLFSGNTNSTTSGYALFTFPIPLRVAPTSLQTSALLVGRTGEATVAIATITFSNASMQSVLLNFTGSGFPIAWSYVTISSASNGFLAFNAEL